MKFYAKNRELEVRKVGERWVAKLFSGIGAHNTILKLCSKDNSWEMK
jgi:hypothetical protein